MRTRWWLLILAVAAFAFFVAYSRLTAEDYGYGRSPTATERSYPSVDWRTTRMDRRDVGEVLLNNMVIYRFRSTPNKLQPGEYARTVAYQLTDLLKQGYTWRDVNLKKNHDNTLLRMEDNIIVTITPRMADDYHITTRALGEQWLNNTQNALRGLPLSQVAGSEERWPTWSKPDTKIVPIISLGTPGARLGFAQVTGPQERVDQVKAVVQLDAEFQKTARVHIFVPSSILAGMNRVQGVAVSALLQYELFRF